MSTHKDLFIYLFIYLFINKDEGVRITVKWFLFVITYGIFNGGSEGGGGGGAREGSSAFRTFRDKSWWSL